MNKQNESPSHSAARLLRDTAGREGLFDAYLEGATRRELTAMANRYAQIEQFFANHPDNWYQGGMSNRWDKAPSEPIRVCLLGAATYANSVEDRKEFPVFKELPKGSPLVTRRMWMAVDANDEAPDLVTFRLYLRSLVKVLTAYAALPKNERTYKAWQAVAAKEANRLVKRSLQVKAYKTRNKQASKANHPTAKSSKPLVGSK